MIPLQVKDIMSGDHFFAELVLFPLFLHVGERGAADIIRWIRMDRRLIERTKSSNLQN
jgi:hypothetical protein